jgi:hypothetical protein
MSKELITFLPVCFKEIEKQNGVIGYITAGNNITVL